MQLLGGIEKEAFFEHRRGLAFALLKAQQIAVAGRHKHWLEAGSRPR